MPEHPTTGTKQEAWMSNSFTLANEQNLDKLGPVVLIYS